MLIPGIKIGQRDWRDKIAANPRFVEVWYRVDQAEKYPPILAALQQQNIPFGLHFWAVTSTGHEPNVAYPGKDLAETISLIKQCLEHASSWQASYVNIHSGNRSLMQLNFDTETMTTDTAYPLIPDAEAVAVRSQTLTDLASYAHQYNVALLVEAIPAKIAGGGWHSAEARLHPTNENPTSLDGLSDLCKRRLVGFTNDFCHTFAMEYDKPRDQLVKQFQAITQTFLPHTYLCHISTLSLPYNGTDEHHGMLQSDMNREGVFPNQAELTKLLQLYKPLPHDVYLVGEPMENHVENYHALCQLIHHL